MTLTFLGFDPGGRESGIVIRRREELLGHAVVRRQDDLVMPDGAYTRAVTGTARCLLEEAGIGARDDGLVVCSEGVRYWPRRSRGHPCPACGGRHDPEQGRDRNLTGVLGTAIVHGAIVERWPTTVVVPPGSGHGSLHDLAYPEPIRLPPGGKGHDLNRHARSAWDATYHGENLYLTRQRGVPQ